jgi:hypothetical protein
MLLAGIAYIATLSLLLFGIYEVAVRRIRHRH